jgi:hypothetical protein
MFIHQIRSSQVLVISSLSMHHRHKEGNIMCRHYAEATKDHMRLEKKAVGIISILHG